MTFFDEFIQGWADFWSASLGEKLPTGFLERVVFLISQYGMSFARRRMDICHCARGYGDRFFDRTDLRDCADDSRNA